VPVEAHHEVAGGVVGGQANTCNHRLGPKAEQSRRETSDLVANSDCVSSGVADRKDEDCGGGAQRLKLVDH
jgi:hypothetical protein